MTQHQDDARKQEQAADPTPPVVRLASAEVDAAAAKDRLNDTVARLQSKLDPRLIAAEAKGEAKRAGERGVTLARENREALLGLAGGVILYLLRKPLLSIFKRRKYPKPQKAAKPMTATAPNERLARQPHPAQSAPQQPTATSDSIPGPATGADLTPKTPLGAAHPTQTAAQSNEGAPLQGTTL